jgi:Monooxygenase af470-like
VVHAVNRNETPHRPTAVPAHFLGRPADWRSFDHLEAFARKQDDPHLEPWRKFWKRVGKSGRTGIWHETFLVRDGEYETIYGNMPPRGLGNATRLVLVAESAMARQRLRARRTVE